NADTSDHVGPTAPCPCGLAAHYAARHEKTFESVLGAAAAFARLLPLRVVRDGLLSARLRPGPAGGVPVAGCAAHGCTGGRDGQLRRRPRVARRVGWRRRTDQARRARG